MAAVLNPGLQSPSAPQNSFNRSMAHNKRCSIITTRNNVADFILTPVEVHRPSCYPYYKFNPRYNPEYWM